MDNKCVGEKLETMLEQDAQARRTSAASKRNQKRSEALREQRETQKLERREVEYTATCLENIKALTQFGQREDISSFLDKADIVVVPDESQPTVLYKNASGVQVGVKENGRYKPFNKNEVKYEVTIALHLSKLPPVYNPHDPDDKGPSHWGDDTMFRHSRSVSIEEEQNYEYELSTRRRQENRVRRMFDLLTVSVDELIERIEKATSGNGQYDKLFIPKRGQKE